MKITHLLAWPILACTMFAAAHAQDAKPELKLLDFNSLDKNHDGKLSRLEAQADPELYMEFDELDVNHDGYLSMNEFQAWPRARKTKAIDPATAPGGSSGAQHLPNH